RDVRSEREPAIAEALAVFRGGGDGLWVDVEAEKPARGRAAFEDGGGVAARADGAVEIPSGDSAPRPPILAEAKLGEYVGHENRLMTWGAAPRSPKNRIPTRSRGPGDRVRSRSGRARGWHASVRAPRPRGGRSCRCRSLRRRGARTRGGAPGR